MRALVLSTLLFAAACNDSKGYTAPGPVPTIVSAAGPANNVAACSPADAGGSCPLPITVVFRLAEGSFVDKAVVRFPGDQNDDGVDRAYVLPNTFGQGDTKEVSVVVDAAVPPSILRAGALYTYTVYLLTGAGDKSAETTLSVSVP